MNISMMPTHFMSLPDIVLLEVFGYLSYEDALYAFANLPDFHFIDLLTEHGAFRRICLSSQLSFCQYKVLSQGIWRYDLVRSVVCKEMFSDFINDLTPCPIFPALNELRILFLRCPSECLSEFVITHSSTLTHLTVSGNIQSFKKDAYRLFLYDVLPHLSRLKLFDTEWESRVSLEWNDLSACRQSMEHLRICVESMSDLYTLAVDGFFPALRSLRVRVMKALIKTVSKGLPAITSLGMPKLEMFDLCIRYQATDTEEEKQVEWKAIETLTSHSVMPRLRRCSLLYYLSTSNEIQSIFQSSLFNNDVRDIRLRFLLCLVTSTSVNLSDTINISDIRSAYCNEMFMKYTSEDKSELHQIWFTQSWPSYTRFWINPRDVAPRGGVRRLQLSNSNTSLHSLSKLYPDVSDLLCKDPASLYTVDSLSAPTPLINIRHLIVLAIIPGLELLFDGVMLPHLRSLDALIVPLFVTFARRANQMKTLDNIDFLMVTDQEDGSNISFSVEQWCTMLMVLPRLRTLLVQLNNVKCPPMAISDLFIDYLKRTTQAPLTLFSCCIDDQHDTESKEHFIAHLGEGIEMACPSLQLASVGSTRLDAWM